MEYYVRMSFRQWLVMFMLFVMYVLLGTSIFYTLEHNLETERRAVDLQERIKINELLATYTSPDDIEIQNMVLNVVSDYCGRKVTNHTLDAYVPPYVWDVFHAFYFSFTTCTTVGYGNISPSNSLGRTILCFYALFGIPISCFFIATIAHFFADTYIKLYRQYNEYKHATTKNYVPPAVGLVGKICLYLTPGIIIFIFLPAILFAYFEDWDYMKAVYFSFVTLSTVGYGDLVATFQAHQEREFGTSFFVYEAFIIIWNLAGLGYVLMIINFIAKGMKSKRVAKLEHKIAENIRATEQIVRQEVSKDLSFLRRLLNEANLMKVKPIYTDTTSGRQYHTLVRSPSCPELMMYHPKCVEHDLRCRSYSVSVSRPPSKMGTPTLNKAQSDSDLNRIDRRKTFENSSSNQFDNGDLIRRVVSALGSINQNDEDERSIEFGMSGFSDSQILSTERRNSGWSLPPFDLPVSHVGSLTSSKQNVSDGSNLNETRVPQMLDSTKDKKSNTSLPPYSRSVSLNIPEDDRNEQVIGVNDKMINKSSSPVSRLMPDQGKRNSITIPGVNSQMNLDRMKAKRDSIISLPRQYISATSKGRDSLLSILDTPINATNSEFLEKTSIADLIRALEVVYSTSSQKEVECSDVPTNAKNKNDNSRRGSLRPIPGYTTIFTSSDSMRPIRKISSNSNPESSLLSRHLSLRPRHAPPQYTETVPSNPMKFNVRPSNTSQERGNSSLLMQKKVPLGPSPLARNEITSDSTKQAGSRKRITELIRM